MPPRILILTQYFPPEMGAPQARLSELGVWLQKFGWDVQVLTALPNYPTGKVFNAYSGKRCVRETVNGLDTVRTWLIPAQSPGALPRMVCYLSFAWSAFHLGAKRCPRPDVIWVESPPLLLGLTARGLARRWKIPYVMNVSDLWPDSLVDIGRLKRRSLSYRVLKRIERACYRQAAGVTGQSMEIVESVRQVVPEANVELISNGVDPTIFGKHFADQQWRDEAGWSGKCVFLFAGLHGLSQGLDQILALAAALRHRRDILFALVGDGPVKADLQAAAANAGLTNVRFYPAQRRERMPAVLSSADVALITLSSAIGGAVPSKIYEAMASEIPILLVAEGEAADRVARAEAGLTVNCHDLEGLVATTLRLAEYPDVRSRLGAAGRRAAEQVYARDAIARRLADFLSRVVSGELRPVEPRWGVEPRSCLKQCSMA